MGKWAVVALVVAVLSGLGGGSPAFAQPEVKELVLGFGIDPPFAPHIVAIQKGWFKEAGFAEVSTKTFTAGVLAGEALVAGKIHLWTPGQLPPISMFHNGIPVVVLGTNCVNWGLEKLVARKDANIQSPTDLYRVRIGLLQGSTSGAMLHYIAQHYGLDEKRLQVVNLAPPEQLASLTSGQVQAMLVWEPWAYRAVRGGAAQLLHTGTTSHFAANHGERVKVSDNRSVFVASQAFVRKNPKATRALMQVMLRAQRFVADPNNRDEVIRMFAEFQKQDVETNRAIWNDFVFNPAFDQEYVDDMERTAAFLAGAGRIKSPTQVLDYTYTDPVAQVDAGLVRVKGRWKP